MSSFWQYLILFILVISALFVLASFLGGIIKTKKWSHKINELLSRYGGIRGNILAAAIGVVTPFCSCTTVPIFAGLLEAEVSFGIAISFLIASPAINVAAIIVLLVLFGFKLAVLYVVASFVVAVIGGYILGKLKLQDQIRPSFISLADNCRVKSWRDALSVSIKSFKYFSVVLIASAVIGALIHNYVPDELLFTVTMGNSLWAVPIAVAFGSVIYSDIIVLIPIGYSLLTKGVNQGIVFAFMIAAAGISISGLLLLSKIIKTKPLVYFVINLLVLYTLLGVAFYFL